MPDNVDPQSLFLQVTALREAEAHAFWFNCQTAFLVIASQRVRAKRGPMTGSREAIQNASAEMVWIASAFDR